MKKILLLILAAMLTFSICGCGGNSDTSKAPEEPANTESQSDENKEEATQRANQPEAEPEEAEPEEAENTESVDIHELKKDDEVSIVGQVASSGLSNGDTLWVQVQQDDNSFVIYHCQLKDEFLEEGESYKLLDVAKVKGYFLSLMDAQEENTSPLVTLYDCELLD